MSGVDFNSLTPTQQQDLLNGPALPPPDNVTPNFDNPPNGGTLARVVLIIALTTTTVLVFVRLYSVWFIFKKAHISDYMLIPVYCLYVSFTSILFLEADVGFLVHQWNFRLRDVPPLFHLFNTATNLFAVDIMLMKAAILLEWLRIFVPRGEHGYFYWICRVLLLINFLFYSAGIIALDLTCIPFEKTWDRTLPGRCIDSKGLDITSATISFLIDLAILCLPQQKIWNLHLSFEKKIGVAAVFAVGVFGCVAAAFRLVVTVQYSRAQDNTYDFSRVTLWVLAEMTSGIIILCVPALPKFLSSLGIPKKLSSLKSWVDSSISDTRGVRYNPSQGRSTPRRYHDLDGNMSIPLGNFPEGSQTRWNSFQEVNQQHAGPAESAILRTTHVSTTFSENNSNQNFISGASNHHNLWDIEAR
ncbi:hypothetical protein F4810DRAFT_679833 [Camillea tinctor]|nr:hypothetical protein F4810DRAFT_679833 [Camillea tinctor]